MLCGQLPNAAGAWDPVHVNIPIPHRLLDSSPPAAPVFITLSLLSSILQEPPEVSPSTVNAMTLPLAPVKGLKGLQAFWGSAQTICAAQWHVRGL